MNVLIDFDPTVADHKTGSGRRRGSAWRKRHLEVKGETREILVCYDYEFAPDFRIVTERTGLGVEELMAAHLQGDYSVYRYGFAPGYAYLGGAPEPIQLPRKSAVVRADHQTTGGYPKIATVEVRSHPGVWRLKPPFKSSGSDAARGQRFDPKRMRRQPVEAFLASLKAKPTALLERLVSSNLIDGVTSGAAES